MGLTAQDQQSRADFERELIANRQFKQSDFCFIDGAYTGDDDLQFAWDVWQAARALPARGVDPMLDTPAGLEPVATIASIDEHGPCFGWRQHWANFPVGTKLYTAAQVQAMLAARGVGNDEKPAQTRMDAGSSPGPGLPSGWQAVPVEPTEEQLGAVRQKPHPANPNGWDVNHRRIYRQMLATAPRPPAAQGDMGIPIAAAQELVVGPCGQCKDDREPCSCAIDTMLKERGQIAVNRERHLAMAKQAKAAQELKPLTPEQIHKWWASENGLEDCDMGKLIDFTTVVREFESKLGVK